MASKSGNRKKTVRGGNTKNSAKNTGRAKKPASSAKNYESFLAAEIAIWASLAICIFLLISSFGMAGFVGNVVAGFMQKSFGWIAYILPIILFCGVAFLVSNKGNSAAYIKTVAGGILTVLLCVMLQLIDERGGTLGSVIVDFMTPAVGVLGTYVISVILIIICVVLITERSILGSMKKGGAKAYDRAREDMYRHREEARERRVNQETMSPKRMNHQVSGVSFNTTLGKEDDSVKEITPKKKTGTKAKTKVSAHEEQDAEIPSVSIEVEEPVPALNTERELSVENVTINRAMPLSAKELIPEPEIVIEEETEAASESKPLQTIKTETPGFSEASIAKLEKPDEKKVAKKP